MRVIRFLVKLALLPVILILTLLQWFFIFLIGFSSVVFNVLAGLFLLTAILSYLMEISDSIETLGLIATGFVIFIVPVMGEWFVLMIVTMNARFRKLVPR